MVPFKVQRFYNLSSVILLTTHSYSSPRFKLSLPCHCFSLCFSVITLSLGINRDSCVCEKPSQYVCPFPRPSAVRPFSADRASDPCLCSDAGLTAATVEQDPRPSPLKPLHELSIKTHLTPPFSPSTSLSFCNGGFVPMEIGRLVN